LKLASRNWRGQNRLVAVLMAVGCYSGLRRRATAGGEASEHR
jgi:hypothetical protein